MQCRLLLLLIAICACTVRCSQPDIRRVPRDAEWTGHYIAVLRKDTSHERLLEIVDLLRNFTDGCKVYGYMETAIKAIVLGLSYDALQEVRNTRYFFARARVKIVLYSSCLVNPGF